MKKNPAISQRPPSEAVYPLLEFQACTGKLEDLPQFAEVAQLKVDFVKGSVELPSGFKVSLDCLASTVGVMLIQRELFATCGHRSVPWLKDELKRRGREGPFL